ncbi:MAG TPA: HIT domain-containing protein [Candidatus Acidoferrales bacterium]|nr:HIT domain-containing protein [Candidatus Acidoferrales bacterium]
MDYIWTPWRYRYVAEVGKDDPCIFCGALAANDDAGRRIVHRGRLNFIILNLYPYTTGHSMIVPYKHVPDLAGCDAETLAELMQLAQRLQVALARIYHPEGFNLGMNLGRCAGAGVTGHVHMHVLPRWSGDSSFMTTVAETRLHPEDLDQTYAKLRREFSGPAS